MSVYQVCPLGVALALLALSGPARGQPAPQISLPETMAVELPAGTTALAPSDPPLRDLLATAKSGQRQVTNDLRHELKPGATRVTWTAWAGDPGKGVAVATRAATVFVLPTGLTQAGVSGDENATAGNNAVHIARDSTGHVHMVWVDSGREGGKTGPIYRRATTNADGAVQFETPLTPIAEGTPGEWTAYPSLAVFGDSVIAAWQGRGTARTRRLSLGPSGYTWGPVRDTGAKSDGRDVGPAIAADAKGIHVITPSGIYARSTDGGQTWKTEPMPIPAGQHIKTASLTLDPAGDVTVAFSSVVRPVKDTAKNTGSGGYWQLRTIVRKADGSWTDARDALEDWPAWGEPVTAQDALADWVRIGIDGMGGTHLLWHGTAASRIYGNDEAYYSYRPFNGDWVRPFALVPTDPARGIKFSFAPSLAINGEHALAAVFYDVFDGDRWGGFDADLIPLWHGAPSGPALPLSRFVRASIEQKTPEFALSTRFPAVAPGVFHAPDGRAWLDVLETLIPMGVPDSAKLIVYQRIDVTGWLKQ
jgi:hypothetical protein